MIERRKGLGTFVHAGAPGLWLLQSSEGFFQDEVDRLGRTVTSQILRADRGPLPAWAYRAGAWDAEMHPFDCYRAWLRTDRTRIEIQAAGPAAAATFPLPATRGETER
jgi:hypothetical protein